MLKVAVFFACAVVVLSQNDCKQVKEDYQDCVKSAVFAAVGIPADFDYSAAKDAVKQCFADNGCEMPWAGRGGKSDEDSSEEDDDDEDDDEPSSKEAQLAEYMQCKEDALGMPFYAAFKQCLSDKGVETPDWDGKSDPHAGKRGKNGKGKGCSMKKLFMADKLSGFLDKICGDSAEAVKNCITDAVGFDATTIDKEAARVAYCDAKESCQTDELADCKAEKALFWEAKCACIDELKEQVKDCPKPDWGGRKGRGHHRTARGAGYHHGGRKMCPPDQEKPENPLCAADFSWDTYKPWGGKGKGHGGRRGGRHH